MPQTRGWKHDAQNSRLAAQYDGTEVFDFDANDLAVAVATTFASAVTVSAGGLTVTAGGLTVTAGGLTVTGQTIAQTVTAGGLTVTADGLTVTDGGLVVRGSSRIREALTLANVTTANNETLTAAQLVGGLITRDPAGGNRTDTTATGTEIETELEAQGMDLSDDDTFLCYLINTADGAETITLAGGTGVTVANAGQTIAQNESALLLFQRTAENTFTLYILGA